MQIDDLQAKARVATDLFEKGAARVKITDTDIEVDWREFQDATTDKGPVSQTVNVNVSAVATSSVNLSQQIEQIIRQLEQKQLNPARLETARKQLARFEEELQRPRPRWTKGKQILKWALSLGEELFLRLVTMWAQRHGPTGVS